MRNYIYHSRIVTELYRDGALSRCEIITLHYDRSWTSHRMWIIKSQFETAMDGDQDTRRAIEEAYTDLVKFLRI